ncbi:hypothetical protein, partial [Legionella tunisiensis]|uniref:hypothetical protein n=1 Tax=Legionella tunisiensis TaxID=1034944 RepID=UPI0005926114
QALETREIVTADPLDSYKELVYPSDYSYCTSLPPIDDRWKERIYEGNTSRDTSTNRFFGYRLGSISNTTSATPDLENLRARRLAYFEQQSKSGMTITA